MTGRRVPVVTLSLGILLLAALAWAAGGSDQPLRTGTVVGSAQSGGFTYLQLADGQGNEFWIITTHCEIPKGARVEILAGKDYGRVESKGLKKTVEELWEASLLRMDGKEIEGLAVHQLPQECVDIPEERKP